MPTNDNSVPARSNVSLPTSFEANLRGKHKKMFADSHRPTAAKSRTSELEAHRVGDLGDMTIVEKEEKSRVQEDEAGSIQKETVTPIVQAAGDAEPSRDTANEKSSLKIHETLHGTVSEEPQGSGNAEDLESSTGGRDSPAALTTEQKGKGKATGLVLCETFGPEQEMAESEDDPEEEDDGAYFKDGGDPPSADGWHQFPYGHRGPRLTIVLHDDNSGGITKYKENMPVGIRGPEGYLWGRFPDDLLWAVLAPGVCVRVSTSQLRYMGWASHVEAFEPGMEDVEGAKPLFSGPSNTLGLPVEFFCGKPEPAGYMGYPEDILATDVNRLDIHLSFDELPLTLDVFDEDDVTNPDTHDYSDPKEPNFDRAQRLGHPVIPISPGSKPLKYRLVDPTGKNTMERKPGQATNATLIISKSRQIGAGNSARVYDGQISLETRSKGSEDDPPRMRFPPRLRVVTKVGTGNNSEKYMLNEATLYNSFPPHLSQEYTGFQLVKPRHTPYRLSPIVPCFYGFYQPVEAKIEGTDSHRSSITLTEDCGSQIDVNILTQNLKAEIYSMFQRFHNAGFAHQSVFPRNILIQPGSTDDTPMSLNPRWARSMRTPSFRIIDFGRSVILTDRKENNPSPPWEPRDRTDGDGELIRGDIHQLKHAIKMHILLTVH